MSSSMRFTSCSAPLLHQYQLGFSKLPCTSICRFPSPYYLQKCHNSLVNQNLTRRLCSINGESNAYPDKIICSNSEGSEEKSEADGGSLKSSIEVLEKLKRYGISGILSYGLLNTVYYLTTFLLVWFYVAPAPGKMGYFAAVKRFLKVMAMVWGGSQVTKLIRAGGALALAPFVDRGLSWFTVKFQFESQGKAFMAIVGLCFGLALVLFFIVTFLWA